MNDIDPITEWENAVKSRIGDAAIIIVLLVLIGCCVAPILAPTIKQFKRRKYVLHENYEELAEADMKSIRVILWIVAIVGWTIIILCNVYD